MSRWLKVVLLVLLVTAGGATAWAQMAPPPPGVALPPPVPPGVTPAWTPVPSSPKVFYALNIPSDLFLLHKRYYYYFGGAWYQSKHLAGSWHPVRKPHPALYRVSRTYFKTPPPW